MLTINNITVTPFFENKQKIIVSYENDIVDLWVDGLINSDFFKIDLDTDLTINKISNNQIEITSDIIGWNRINVSLSNIPKAKGTKKTRLIGSLILVVENKIIKADTTIYKSDTTIITSDNG